MTRGAGPASTRASPTPSGVAVDPLGDEASVAVTLAWRQLWQMGLIHPMPCPLPGRGATCCRRSLYAQAANGWNAITRKGKLFPHSIRPVDAPRELLPFVIITTGQSRIEGLIDRPIVVEATTIDHRVTRAGAYVS